MYSDRLCSSPVPYWSTSGSIAASACDVADPGGGVDEHREVEVAAGRVGEQVAVDDVAAGQLVGRIRADDRQRLLAETR